MSDYNLYVLLEAIAEICEQAEIDADCQYDFDTLLY
jgi:hypothetical protein